MEDSGQLLQTDDNAVENMLTEKELDSFLQLVKNGIYKELHRRKLLNDAQLNILLKSSSTSFD